VHKDSSIAHGRLPRFAVGYFLEEIRMIHQTLFGGTVANWLNQTIASSLSDKAVWMKATTEAVSEIVRARPDMIPNLAESMLPQFPFSKLGIFKDGLVDTQIIRIALGSIFKRVQNIDLKQYIPNYSYNLTAAEVESLCKALESAEGASALLDRKECAPNV
jgi:hypothetical protein